MRLLAFAFALPALAGAGIIGHITVDEYAPLQLGSGASGLSGVTLRAHYTVSNPGALVDCCGADGLRWMQLIESSAGTGFTPDPNRPFIDPRPGQSFGEGVGDTDPFYDAAYQDATLEVQQPGIGPYLFDAPAVINLRASPSAEYRFMARTLLVTPWLSGDSRSFMVLGGFSWGFAISAEDGGGYFVERLRLHEAGLTSEVIAAFNAALSADFPSYSLASCVGARCDDARFTLTPEPSSFLLISVPALTLALCRLRKKF